MVSGVTNENFSGSTRRRGSGFGTILSTFGIRQSSSITEGENSAGAAVSGEAAVPISINSSNNISNPNVGIVSRSGPTNMMSTTPFDASEDPARNISSVSGTNNGDGNALPINLVLGQVEMGNANPTGNDHVSVSSPPAQNSLNNNASLKNVHHFIYPAVRPPNSQQINLDFPPDFTQPEDVDEETVRLRKDKNGLFTLRLTSFIDNTNSSNPGFYFDPIIRTAGPGSQLVIGRYTEKVRDAIASIPEPFHPAVFKSKVVSRTHGVFKVDDQGNWYIKDVKSSSGTFLNHQRLSQAAWMSKDHLLKDGDILQLGLDFRGGTEEIYRCVKMRVELNKSWKRRANAFNKEAIQRIKDLQKMTTGVEQEDCSICLSKIKPCQAVFISPCSHSWHYQCVRRLLMNSYPQFVCPNCRSVCDLEASIDSDDDDDESGLYDYDEDVYQSGEDPGTRRPFSPVNDDSGSPILCPIDDNRVVYEIIHEHEDEQEDVRMLN